MIRRVHVKYFKRYKDQVFDLSDHLVLAGPNNSGKTTLLQAIVIWSLALQKWRERRGPDNNARLRTGVPITRQDFTALPLRLMEHLWTNTVTGLTKDERGPDQKQGAPRVLEIHVEGATNNTEWRLGFEFRYSSSEQLYVRATPHEIPGPANDLTVAHVPPFSGIGHAETRLDRPFQDLLIGQGKAGDILRNLLLEVHQQGDHPGSKWSQLCEQVSDLFKVELLPPEYAGTPHIVCEFVHHDAHAPKRGKVRLDVASAGSGFHQVLLLLGFFYARPATILLLDEPDAHLHVMLQKQIYDTIRRVATLQRCQVLIATHSEVLIDNTSPEQILSFYGKPHPMAVRAERDRVREALKRLTAMDLLLAEHAKGVFYAEDQTDVELLRAWARKLDHALARWLDAMPLIHLMKGRRPREAREHFFALEAAVPSIAGAVLLDGDNKSQPDTEVAAPRLQLRRWRRYEAESYLVHPSALRRFAESLSTPLMAQRGDQYLADNLPPVLYRTPLLEHDYWAATPASKTLLPNYLTACGLNVPKTEYYMIAEAMNASEIPSEVREMLDSIAEAIHVSPSAPAETPSDED